MNARRYRWLAWAFLALFAASGGGWLAQLDYHAKVSTDVLDLLPPGERDPQLAVVRELASEAEARTMLLVLTSGSTPVPREVAREFAARMARSPHFSEALALAEPSAREKLGRTLFEHRMTLLFPLWLRGQEAAFAASGGTRFEEWLAEKSAADLETFLQRPQAVAFQDLLAADPLLLVPRAFETAGKTLAAGGAAEAAQNPGLIWAQASASPLTEEGQEPVFAAIEEIASTLRAEMPGLHVAYTGVNRFAHASRARIQREVGWLNTASLVAVIAVAAVFIRRFRDGLHLLPVVLLSLLAGWAGTTATFARVHIVVLVLGSLLAGVAIDYGLHIFAQPPLSPDEGYGTKLRRLLKPLLASCLTTVAGFALLLATELPLLRQLGVFVVFGLVGAALAAIAYFGAVGNPHLRTRGVDRPWLPVGRHRKKVALAFLALAAVACAGLPWVGWRDDIRELEIPAAELRREDARIREQFGMRPGAVWLTSGRTLDEARMALRQLEEHPAVRGVPLSNLSPIVPTSADHADALRFARAHPAFGGLLRAALQRHGFEPAEFAAFFDVWSDFIKRSSAADLNAALAAVQRSLPGPLQLLLHHRGGLTWFVSLVDAANGSAPPSGTNTIAVAQLDSLNELFARYRSTALRLSLAGLAVIGGGVVVAYGLRDGLRIFAVPSGACLGVFGLFGWWGAPLNMFHLLGAFLAVCLTYDYAIFSVPKDARREAPPISVRLAALTTAASFGVLATSAIPAVRALGLTVALVVIAALLTLEVAPFRSLRGRA